MSDKFFRNIETSEALDFAALVSSNEGIVESRRFINRKDIKMTMVSLPQGEGINPYALPGDTLIIVLDGDIEVVIGGVVSSVKSGECIVATAGIAHGITPLQTSKVLTIEVKTD